MVLLCVVLLQMWFSRVRFLFRRVHCLAVLLRCEEDKKKIEKKKKLFIFIYLFCYRFVRSQREKTATTTTTTAAAAITTTHTFFLQRPNTTMYLFHAHRLCIRSSPSSSAPPFGCGFFGVFTMSKRGEKDKRKEKSFLTHNNYNNIFSLSGSGLTVSFDFFFFFLVESRSC
jgi:hypothetical protein